MKLYHNKPIKASEIRYTRPNGRESVVYTDNGDYKYVVKEIEEVMGHDFAFEVQNLFETWEGYLNEYHKGISEEVSDYSSITTDLIDEAVDKLLKLQKYMKQPGSADDKTVLEFIDNTIDDVSSISTQLDWFIEQIDAVNSDFDL